MNLNPFPTVTLAWACAALLAWNAHAQTEPTNLAAAAAAAPTPAAGSDTCVTVTDKAMAADLGAANAQSKKQDLAEQLRWNEASITLWMQAIGLCEGRGKARAQRNLTDSQKARMRLQEQMASGPQCEAAHKNATSLQELAKQALTERRFGEAAALYRKSEDTWDLASERCTGTQQALATQRREQTASDSHNAEHCAPQFEKAREQTQKFRANSASLSREDKQKGSLVVETLWRDALVHCKDVVLDAVRSNAQLVARERGTPWVATRADLAVTVAVPIAAAALATAAKPSTPTATPAATSNATIPVTPVAAPAPVAPAVPEPQPAEFTAGTTRFTGRFVRDVDAATFTGTGKLVWANGDVFDGTLAQGLRHGKGLFIWANGQRYHGDWVRDQPTGRADIQFVNGNAYEGEVLQGLPNGAGKMRYASGDNYLGQFLAGAPEGRGTYVWANGQRFEGLWRAGRSQGDGQLSFANGDTYTGPVVHGTPQGQGQFKFASGDGYVGQLTQGQPNGLGTYTWANGDQYVGHWKAGQKHGQGVFTWKTGQRWEGRYENDVQAAQATATADTATAATLATPATQPAQVGVTAQK
jgi:hypothetical protein